MCDLVLLDLHHKLSSLLRKYGESGAFEPAAHLANATPHKRSDMAIKQHHAHHKEGNSAYTRKDEKDDEQQDTKRSSSGSKKRTSSQQSGDHSVHTHKPHKLGGHKKSSWTIC